MLILAIDSGSTTTKFVLMDENENILDSFYAPNEGDPLTVAKTALLTIHDRYEKAGAKLDIIAAGTTATANCCFQKLSAQNAMLWKPLPTPGLPTSISKMPHLSLISAVRI